MRRRLRDGRDGRALVEELERMGETLSAAGEKSHWYLELGVICEMLVPERQRALQLYRRAVELDAGNAEALDRGRMVCRELGRLDELIRLCEIDLAHEPDESRREQLTARIGEALLNLGDRQRAAGFLVGAAGNFPASLPIQDALATIGYDDDWRGELDRLVDIGADAEPEAGARVSLRAARILHMQEPTDPRYEELLKRVLAYDPYDESAHLLLDRLYTEQGRWEDLDAVNAALVEAFPGVDEQAALSQRFSFAWIGRGQHDRAASWCWRAIELGRLIYPIAGLTLLRGIYAARRQWPELLEAIDALLATPLDEDADVHISLLGGTIAWKATNDVARASRYFDRVRRVAVDSLLLIDFDDALAAQRNPEELSDEQRALVEAARKAGKSDPIERVAEAWKRAIAVDRTKRAPRRALARALHRAERWRALADALKDEETHACRDDAERVGLLMQLAALYRDRLRQDLLLTTTLQRAVELQPANLAALDQLERAFAGMRRWSDVVATLQRQLALAADDGARIERLVRLAAVYRDELGNEAEAVKASEQALALDPARAELADWLATAYARRREWEKLFALKQAAAARIEDRAARLAAYVELAQLATDKVKKPALATAAWAEVLALDPDHEAALIALERLYAVTDQHAKLAEIYARRAEQPTADLSTQLGYLQKLAQLCTVQLADPARAIDAWRKLLDLQPVHARALETLKKLYVTTRRWNELEQAFAEERRLDECARLFEREAALLGDGSDGAGTDGAVELWLRAARLWRDRLSRRPDARRAYERALELVPGGQSEAVEALATLYDEAGDAQKLSGVLALQIAATDDAETRRTRLIRLAALHARELDDAGGAFDWQKKAFNLLPSDAAVRAELERLATASGRTADLIAHYERICDSLSDDDRVALLVVTAQKKELVGDVDGALATWQSLAALTPPPPAALPALARIYEARGEWRALHDVYARKLALAGDPAERRPIVSAMAALAERQGDDERAIVAYRRLWDEFGADDETLEALERLYGRGGALAELEAVLVERRGLASASAPASRTAITFRLAEVRRHLGRVPEAVALYAEVLDAEPQHAGAQAALESIADGPTHRLEAALLLEPIVRAIGAPARLQRVLAIRVEQASDPDEAVALLHEIAWIEERELARPDAAFATLARALERVPAHTPTFDAIEALSARTGDWQRLLAAYKQVAVQPLSIAEHVEVRCRLGALYRQHLGDLDRALATYRRVLDLAPDDARAAAAIDDLLAAAGRFGELAERLREPLQRN
jgi:golgin subfamily B member 1